MLFSSFYFLLIFLPVTAAAFWLAGRFSAVGVAVGVLTVASIAFYAVWRPQDVPVLLGSIVVNWLLSLACDRGRPWARAALAVGVVGDLALLFWFKYAVFASIVAVSAHVIHHPLAERVLPLGISFFTFVQIAYLVDRYRGIAPAAGFWKFLLFVCFFPHLIAGPIVHHSTVMPQLDRPRPTGGMVATGLFIFAVGLAKKAVIADPLGAAAKAGFDTAGGLPAVNAWVTVIAYAMQLYFDFSGYSDMAVGLALLFGVEFPWNFLSPYRSTSLAQFWRTWHVTLGGFLRQYVYFPLGGSRAGRARTAVNLLLTMVIGGVWHGAGWTFLLWGALHGLALVVNNQWAATKIKMPAMLGWALTAAVVVAGWVLFRAATLHQAVIVYRAMAGVGGHGLTRADGWLLVAVPYLVVAVAIAFAFPNTRDLAGRFKPTIPWALGTGGLMCLSVAVVLGTLKPPEFLYGAF